MPKFEVNMNYIPPSPPCSMKQSNKSATIKFHKELVLTTTTRKQSRSGATPASKDIPISYLRHTLHQPALVRALHVEINRHSSSI